MRGYILHPGTLKNITRKKISKHAKYQAGTVTIFFQVCTLPLKFHTKIKLSTLKACRD